MPQKGSCPKPLKNLKSSMAHLVMKTRRGARSHDNQGICQIGCTRKARPTRRRHPCHNCIGETFETTSIDQSGQTRHTYSGDRFKLPHWQIVASERSPTMLGNFPTEDPRDLERTVIEIIDFVPAAGPPRLVRRRTTRQLANGDPESRGSHEKR